MTTSNTINLFFNDYAEHNLTIYFSGETYEYIFNSSISEAIALACKSVEATVMWEDIEVPIEGMAIILQFFDGTSWIDIQVAVSDVNGLVSFVGLISGSYRTDSIEFTLDQSTITYTTDMFVVADLTTIDIDYLNTVLGANYPVDLSTITWDIQIGLSEWVSITDGHYSGIIIDNVAGTITIYNLMNGYNYRFSLFDYAGANSTYDVVLDGFTQINLNAKSLDASFEWSQDNAPVVGMDVELFWFDGTSWISVDTYTTDANGKIFLTNILPCGTYKFDDMAEFSITANDNVKTVVYTVESLCVEEKSFLLGFHRDMEFKFFFFVFKLKLIMLTLKSPELSALDFCLLGTPTTSFYAFSDSSIYLLNGGLKS